MPEKFGPNLIIEFPSAFQSSFVVTRHLKYSKNSEASSSTHDSPSYRLYHTVYRRQSVPHGMYCTFQVTITFLFEPLDLQSISSIPRFAIGYTNHQIINYFKGLENRRQRETPNEIRSHTFRKKCAMHRSKAHDSKNMINHSILEDLITGNLKPMKQPLLDESKYFFVQSMSHVLQLTIKYI